MKTGEIANGNRIAGNAAPAKAHESTAIIIEPIAPKVLEIEIVGLTPLLVCNWSLKARRQMQEIQGIKEKTAKKKDPKVPKEDYEGSLYVSTEGWTGVPAAGVKGCLVNACRAVDDLPMTLCKRMIFVQADGFTASGQGLVRIYGEHRMNESMVRVASGAADLRYRAEYPKWSAKLKVEFLPSVISQDQVANLLELAGWVEGLCEHRPGSPKSCTGSNGRFQIKRPD